MKNDYQLNIMNGDTGIIESIYMKDGKETLSIDFDGERVDVPTTNNHLQLAYALTIHKSQGSEYPVVVSIVHKSHSFQHHKNLLYTAVTRASQTSIILGDAWGIRNCAQKEEVNYRRTWMQLLLYEAQQKQKE